jgi:hypothetical protein
MRQVHARAGVGQNVGGPVPAVRGLQHDLGILTPRSDLLGQLKRIIIDANRGTQTITLRRHTHDHTASPM